MKTLKGHFLSVGALALLLCGCGNQRDERVTVAPAKEKERVVNLYSWEDYFAEEVLDAFTEQTGIQIVYEHFETTDEMIARLKSEPGKFDVVVADDSLIAMLNELKLLREIDKSRLKNLGNLDGQYLGLHFDKENRYSLPYLWGTTGIGYRSDKIEDLQNSWALLWDESLKGKVMMYEERHEAYAGALLKNRLPLNSESTQDLKKATEELMAQVRTMGVRYGSDADVREGLGDGSIWAAMCYSGDAYLAAEEFNEHIAYFIPEEGAPLWIDSFVVSRDSRNIEEVHRFLDYMMTAEAAAGNANYLWYSTPNKAAVSLLNEELLGDPNIVVPAEVLKNCDYHRVLSQARQKEINMGMRRVLNLVRERKQKIADAAGDDDS